MSDKKMAQELRIGENLRNLRKSLMLTQVDFGSKIGLGQSYIVELEKGRREPSYKTLLKIAKTFNVDLNWLLTGESHKKELPIIAASPKTEYDVEKKLIAIPIIKEIPIGYPEYPVLNDFIREYLYLPHVPKFAFGLNMLGKSMEPEIFAGDIVIVNPKIKELKRRDLGVFRINNETSLKRYYPQKNGILLQPTNPEYPPILITIEDQYHLIGKVIYKILKC